MTLNIKDARNKILIISGFNEIGVDLGRGTFGRV